MPATLDAARPPAGQDLLDTNTRFYDALWAEAKLVSSDRFNTWPLVAPLAGAARDRLEIAPGLRPRLPIDSTHFLDISRPAVARLNAAGGRAIVGSAHALPYPDERFDLIALLDIIEHVTDDASVLAETARVTRPGGIVLIATPLHAHRWIAFDEFVGHARRYEPGDLLAMLAANHLVIEQSAVYGMQPNSSRLLDWGIWWLTHHRERAIWWYNHCIMPLAMRFQKPLELKPGLIDLAAVDEVLLVCRKTG